MLRFLQLVAGAVAAHAYAAKYTPTLWQHMFEDASMHSGRCTDVLASATDGNAYVLGNFDGTMDFTAGTSRSGTMNFLAKYDKNGALLWVTTFPAGPARIGGELDDGTVVIAGSRHTKGSAVVGEGPTAKTLSSPKSTATSNYLRSGGYAAYVAKFKKTGATGGVKQFEPATAGVHVTSINDVDVHSDGSIAISGQLYGGAATVFGNGKSLQCPASRSNARPRPAAEVCAPSS